MTQETHYSSQTETKISVSDVHSIDSKWSVCPCRFRVRTFQLLRGQFYTKSPYFLLSPDTNFGEEGVSVPHKLRFRQFSYAIILAANGGFVRAEMSEGWPPCPARASRQVAIRHAVCALSISNFMIWPRATNIGPSRLPVCPSEDPLSL